MKKSIISHRKEKIYIQAAGFSIKLCIFASYKPDI